MKRLWTAAGLAMSLFVAAPVAAQENYPRRPITMIVGYGAGGSTDLGARVVAGAMEKILGQPITVENRTGGNGAVGTQAVFNAKPDGYTIGMTSGSILTVLPWTMQLGYDPLKLTYIGSVLESLYALFVSADSPFKTADDLIKFAKSGQRQLVLANSGGFGIPDIAMAQFAQAGGGFQYRTLPTTGGAEQVVRLLAGDADVSPNSAAPTLSHFRSGKLRALLVLSPSWPELEKAGVPLSSKLYGFDTRNLSAIVGPPGLPEDIRKKLEDALAQAMKDPAVQAQLEKVGELIVFKTGAQIHEAAVQTQAVQKAVGEKLTKTAN
jgi:tripartite-type tricarboxylate transporter receptor subunit TctC